MVNRRYRAEEIIHKLRESEVDLARGRKPRKCAGSLGSAN